MPHNLLRVAVPSLLIAFAAIMGSLQETSRAASLAVDAKEDRQTRPLEVADVLHVRELIGDPAFHPFEDLVALAVARRSDAPSKRSVSHFLDNIDERGVPYAHDAARIVVADSHGGAIRSVGNASARSWSPVWSPDGTMLAYLSDADGLATLYAWNRETGNTTRLTLPGVPIGDGRSLRPTWLSDSLHIVVALRSAALPIEGGTTPGYGAYEDGRKVFTSPGSEGVDGKGSSLRHWSRADLILLSLEGGESQRLAEGLSISGFWVSPDDRRIAIEEALGTAPASQRMRSRLLFLDLGDGSVRPLPGELPGDYTAMSGGWLKDGECFVHPNADTFAKTCATRDALESRPIATNFRLEALVEADDRFAQTWLGLGRDERGQSQLINIEPRSGAVAVLASSARYVFVGVGTRPAGGASRAGSMLWVLARDNDTQEAVILRVEANGRLDEVLRDKVAFSSTHARWAASGQNFFTFLEGPSAPPELWRMDASGTHRQSTAILNEPLDGRSFAQPMLLRTLEQGPGGSQGVLLVPTQWRPGVRCPLIVRPYGQQRATNLLYRFGLNRPGVDNLQLLASRGYAVLVPALPLELGAPLKSIHKHVDALVGAAVSQGIVDPERLGLFGHSFGGYASIGLAAGASPVFRSTVVTGPVGLDLFSYYGFMDETSASVFMGWTEDGQSNVGANPWSDPSRLLLNSPLFQVDRIQGPVLIVLGEADTPRVPQSEELYVALRRLGKAAEYRIYQREPHWPAQWDPHNTRDYLDRMLTWFDDTLGAGGSASAIDRGATDLCH